VAPAQRASPARRLSWFCVRWSAGRFQVERGHLVGSIQPSRSPVDDSEQVGVAARRRQRPDQVHVEGGETAVGYRYLCRLQVYVSVNFASLALQAGPGHLSNGLGHLWPAEPNRDEAAGRSHSRVVYRVQRLENRLPVLDRYQRAEHPRRNVPEQRSVADCLGCYLQCGRTRHLCHLRAGPLGSGHCRKVDRLRISVGGQDGPIRCR
jgi:hypothetical protein